MMGGTYTRVSQRQRNRSNTWEKMVDMHRHRGRIEQFIIERSPNQRTDEPPVPRWNQPRQDFSGVDVASMKQSREKRKSRRPSEFFYYRGFFMSHFQLKKNLIRPRNACNGLKIHNKCIVHLQSQAYFLLHNDKDFDVVL